MKEILSVETRHYPRIEVAWLRDVLEISAVSMSMYAYDYNRGFVDKYVLSPQIYISALFRSVDNLYKHYELSQKHFELLDFAASHLEQLCNGKIPCLSEPDEIDRARTELGDYLDKVTMIFQTAADKTENSHYRKFCSDMAQKYSKKADEVRGMFSFRSYEEKMQALYEKAAGKCEEYEGFIKELLQLRAAEYSGKCRVRETTDEGSARFFANAARKDQEAREPLLSSSGLRRRAIAVPCIHNTEL